MPVIVNYKCDDCKIASICQGKNKLKPFTDEAKVDLGVILEMTDCYNYIGESTIVSSSEETDEEDED